MSEFVYESSAWHNRATIAREAGVELGELGQSLETTVAQNYFGRGCEEGAALFAKLQASLRSARTELTSLSEAAHLLAANASMARSQLYEVDRNSAVQLEPPHDR
ncbi:hypothetical protein nbrc107696_25180 [Gordonia spumicola]|uniref:ESX-1 secretion-associated protein n=1 Tax=Gordonia spumicola TaxID=589161 RepID=A0A7I9VA05_9ACTN|nr:hypothetical protein nbrc107696_25180 [Gordonia spumicola]